MYETILLIARDFMNHFFFIVSDILVLFYMNQFFSKKKYSFARAACVLDVAPESVGLI